MTKFPLLPLMGAAMELPARLPSVWTVKVLLPISTVVVAGMLRELLPFVRTDRSPPRVMPPCNVSASVLVALPPVVLRLPPLWVIGW